MGRRSWSTSTVGGWVTDPDRTPRSPLLPSDARRVLIILPSWVGDACMATPLLRHLAEQRPDSKFSAFGRPSLRPLMDGLPWITRFHAGSMRARAARREIQCIRREQFDAVLLLPNSFRSALFARLTGIRHRAGISRDARGWLLTHRLARRQSGSHRGTPRSALDEYASLAEWWTGKPLTDRRVALRVTDSERAQASELLKGCLDSTRNDLILLNPGANRTDKRWSAANFARAAHALSLSRPPGDPPRPIAVTGGPAEAQLCASVAAQCDGIDLCARGISIGSLKAVLERTALLVTNDTGPRHIAAALGTPTVALFGPTDCRWTPLDYPNERRVVANPFLPEESIADDHPALCSIDKICVEDVLHAAHAITTPRVHR